MQYSFHCPACGHMLTVDAADDEAAMELILDRVDSHSRKHHLDEPAMSEDDLKDMVESEMQIEDL